MFVALFVGLVEFLFVVGGVYLVYKLLLSDWLASKRLASKEKKDALGAAQKIAQLKLVSDDAKDIENFIAQNAANLSDDMVKKLVERIESLKCDHLIYEDSLRKRIDQAAQLADEQEEFETKQTRKL
jgi:hypothetical protein